MAYVTPDKFSPYPRTCDICGQLRSINTMRKLDGITWVCDKHTGERTKIMLDTLNAHARPPQTWPNEEPRPQNPIYPNVIDAAEAVVFNFIDQQITNQVRYESVVSGDGAPLSGQMLPALSWSCRYLYDLIIENTRPQRYITRAKALLSSAAITLQTRQRGFGFFTGSTRANSAYYGGFLESDADTYITADTATSGLALLYAYRITGTAIFLVGARAAANFLRNVQAIGSNANQYTSSDSAGTARLYTGAVASEVSTSAGIDPAETFYSNHLFYPSGLIALELWNELKTTDGDQTIGATAVVDGFVSAPSQLMSLSIEDMRDCWEDGIRDSAGETYTGLSAVTPREYFNAYPASKLHFTVAGTGRWEFADGGASTGTTISGQNFARALMALYNYEGATPQAGAISDWLRTFESNPDFETPDDTSTSTLARSTTGDYDPTNSLATVLIVRDSDNSYSATKLNGSSLYDWGAFGLLSRLWASRYKTSFMASRILPLNVNQRFQDGKASDGLYYDYITLRGLSGLTYQTAFTINLDGSDFAVTAGSSAGSSTTPTQSGLVYWVKGDAGLVDDGAGMMVSWANQATLGSNPALFAEPGGYGALVGQDSLDGIPGLTFPVTQPTIIIGLGSGSHVAMKASTGAKFGYGTGEVQARTTIFVATPRTGNFFSICGGTLCRFGTTTAGAFQDFEALFDLEPLVQPNDFYLFSNNWRNGFANTLKGPDTTRATYNGVPIIAEHASSGYPDISVRINNAEVTLTPSAFPVEDAGHPLNDFFTLGTVNQVGDTNGQWHGALFEGLIYDHELSEDEREETYSYLGARFPSIGFSTLAMVNDVVRAAQYGRAFRESRS